MPPRPFHPSYKLPYTIPHPSSPPHSRCTFSLIALVACRDLLSTRSFRASIPAFPEDPPSAGPLLQQRSDGANSGMVSSGKGSAEEQRKYCIHIQYEGVRCSVSVSGVRFRYQLVSIWRMLYFSVNTNISQQPITE